jgi:dimethylamine/trimethylamine dehydrogenase
MTDGTRPKQTYLDRLLRAFEEEIGGEAYYAGLAAHFDEPGAGEKLDLLAQIERRTAEILHPLIERYGLVARDDATIKALGAAKVAEHGAGSWSDYMTWMVRGLPVFVSEFEELEDGAPEADRAALALLTRHEVAAIEFAERELGGDPDAVAPIRAYLEESAPR